MEGSGVPADSSSASSEKRNRPTWIEVTQPYSLSSSAAAAAECTCYSTAAAAAAAGTVAKYSSGRTDAESSVNLGEIRRTCSGSGGRYIGRSRQTISPCCSHWGTVRSCRSPPPQVAETVDETSAEASGPDNSPDFVLSHSAPDLFTIAAGRRANHHQLDAEEDRGVGRSGQEDGLPSENEILLSSPEDTLWLHRDNQALSPVSTTRQFPVNDSRILTANVLKPYDKRID